MNKNLVVMAGGAVIENRGRFCSNVVVVSPPELPSSAVPNNAPVELMLTTISLVNPIIRRKTLADIMLARLTGATIPTVSKPISQFPGQSSHDIQIAYGTGEFGDVATLMAVRRWFGNSRLDDVQKFASGWWTGRKELFPAGYEVVSQATVAVPRWLVRDLVEKPQAKLYMLGATVILGADRTKLGTRTGFTIARNIEEAIGKVETGVLEIPSASRIATLDAMLIRREWYTDLLSRPSMR